MNSTVRLMSHRARGFRRLESLPALIALAMLDRGGFCPPLPGRGA